MLLLGGFLGAGKTTLIAALVKHFQGLGLRCAVVSNDQAGGLGGAGMEGGGISALGHEEDNRWEYQCLDAMCITQVLDPSRDRPIS
jgi:G3E family GTPase